MVEKLIKSGAELDITDKEGWTSLYLAARNGHFEVVEKLIESGAVLNSQDRYGETPIHIASQTGHLEVVKKLIESGANVNIQSKNGKEPKHLAFENKHREVVKKLIDSEVEVILKERKNDINSDTIVLDRQNVFLEVFDELIKSYPDANSLSQNILQFFIFIYDYSFGIKGVE